MKVIQEQIREYNRQLLKLHGWLRKARKAGDKRLLAHIRMESAIVRLSRDTLRYALACC